MPIDSAQQSPTSTAVLPPCRGKLVPQLSEGAMSPNLPPRLECRTTLARPGRQPPKTLTIESQCAVKGAGPQRVRIPSGNWFAPPGSNRSNEGGDEVVEAFDVEGREGDLASVQVVM
jgi:hypothetical protein